MNRRSLMVFIALIASFALASAGFAQGSQTANLIGTVTSADGEPLPGVTITVTSPNLIGVRTAVSAVNGDYIIKNIPAGAYKVLFALDGMTTVERSATLPLGGTSRSDAAMEITGAEETIVVTGEAPSALETTTVGANFDAKQINALPVARNLSSVAELAGGLTDNGTVAGQVTIGGAFAYDNVFLVNGVDVNDRFFGTANNLLVIEEAIEETQILTSGISAEYGRFSGGVINAITKSGGNTFSGSFRTDFTRPEWRDETPIEKDRGITRSGDLSKTYSATLGGRIITDRLWFFAAGRDLTADNNFTLPVSQFNATNTNEQTRYEGKLTGNLSSSHSLQLTYTKSESSNSLERQVTPLEAAALSKNSINENDAQVLAYSGVFTNNLFGELRYSQKHFGFRGLGGTGTRPQDSPFVAIGNAPGTEFGTYNAPYFDASDPEDRDNEQSYGALSYFLSTKSMGSHDLKVGVEVFKDIGVGGNSQTSTGFNPTTDYLTTAAGDPVTDANGNLIPVWSNPYVSGYYTYMAYWVPVRGAKNTIETKSVFFNDHWNLNSNWAFNVGVRYEDIASKSQSGIPTIGSTSIVPRLGVAYDVKGDGKYKIDVTYSEYSGKAIANQFGASSPAGNPALAYGYYVGPEGQGANFAPGFDIDNYVWFYFSNPLVTKDVAKGLKTPRTTEFTVSGGMELAKGGYLKLTYANRDQKDFIEDFTDRQSRLVPVNVGPIAGDLTEVQRIQNSNAPTRTYEALLLQGQYSLTDPWGLGGNWTHELKNDGNFEGEAGQSPGISSTFGDFPEVFSGARNFPTGRLDNFQEDKIRLWSNYAFDFGRGGSLDIGAIYRYDSPLTFSYARASFPLSSIQRTAGAGYYSLPSGQTLYFGERGAGEYEAIQSLDLSFSYGIPVWKTLEPRLKFFVTNVTNETGLVTFNTQIVPVTAAGAPRDAQGLPTTFTKGVNFGKATAVNNYQTPREYFLNFTIQF
ncbi:MAG: TonB-dependent receptor [Thermoanaerobaculia bacterium]